MSPTGGLSDSVSLSPPGSQIYGGISAETAATDAAIAATDGRALVWRGRPATTFYHSSSWNRTVAVADGLPGARAVPYLRSVRDPYDRVSPRHRWSRRVGTGQLAAVAGLGDVRTVRALINGSGRVRYVRLAGAGRSRRISGSALARALGLRLPSAWFRIERRAVMPTRD